jgi:alpha-beta hydrolase superfamily lysophospholipase
MLAESLENRNRTLYVMAAIAVIAIGLASRNADGLFPAALGKYPGDALWTLMVFFFLGSLLQRSRSLHIAAYALIISCAVEVSQLYHSPWIDGLRSNSLVRLVLGSGFDWRDFSAYLLGTSVGFVLEQATGMSRCTFSLMNYKNVANMAVRAKIKFAFKVALLLTLPLLIATAVIAWIAAGELLHPERRALQAYQQDWIGHASSHGVSVHTEKCDHGKVPCLFVSPDPHSGPGERGKSLRKQVAHAGLELRPYGETQGILVLLHGRRGRKEDLLPVAERFAAAGFNCAIPDLPAHGDNPIDSAHFATSDFERRIADGVLADARRHFRSPDSPAGIWGMSMGGAFAVNAVARSPKSWKAAVIVASVDSLDGIVEDKLSTLPMPISNLLRNELTFMMALRGGRDLHEASPARWVRNVTTPVFVAHGDRDPLISPKRARQLFDAFDSPEKKWVTVPGAHHGNILTTDMPLFANMSAWFIAHVR